MKNRSQISIDPDFTINNFKDYAKERPRYRLAFERFTFVSNPNEGETITIISTDGTSKTYEFRDSGSPTAGNVAVSIDSNRRTTYQNLATAINGASGHDGKIFARRQGSSRLLLEQTVPGPNGNTTITHNLSGISGEIENFARGELEDTIANSSPFQPPFSYLTPGVHSIRRK